MHIVAFEAWLPVNDLLETYYAALLRGTPLLLLWLLHTLVCVSSS